MRILTLYPVTLLNLPIRPNSFFGYFFGGGDFLSRTLCNLQIKSLISPFPICFLSIYLSSCLTALGRISFSAMNKSGKKRHLCFNLNLRLKVYSLSALSVMAVSFYRWLLSVSGSSLLLMCWEFLSGLDIEFCQKNFCIFWDDNTYFISVFWYDKLEWLTLNI